MPRREYKCLYTNAHSVRNKQELKTYVLPQGCDLIAITETGWDSSHDWNIVMGGYVLLGRTGQRGEMAELLLM